MEYIIGPPSSPDMSVMETWVKPLRDKFTARRCETIEDGIQRFYQIWSNMVKRKRNNINTTIDSYPARMWECRRLEGRMTKY
jgi:hypothetical protein